MARVKLSHRLKPQTMAGQMILVLSCAMTLLLVTFVVLELFKQQTVAQTAENATNLEKIKKLLPIFETLNQTQSTKVLALTSSCHQGYSYTSTPHPINYESTETQNIATLFSAELNLNSHQISVGHSVFSEIDFSYEACKQGEMSFPLEGIVISIQLSNGNWLNAEIHPHESHIVADILYWAKWSIPAFLFIALIAILFISHLTKPLKLLSESAQHFARGLTVSKVKETGPSDILETIRSFNSMQQKVADEVQKRTQTLAAISHDVRTPLTALRIKAELIEDSQSRQDIISSINKMEKITTSALDFLKGENKTEPMKMVNLSVLLETECFDFAEVGEHVCYKGDRDVLQLCRPVAMARAIRNLIENAVKYGDSAEVNLITDADSLTITVTDNGPGIPAESLSEVTDPFNRLSNARESEQGGFGLGLAIVKAIVEGHKGTLNLTNNTPKGLVACIKLTKSP